ncbi:MULTISPECIES: DUF5985 family protein [unclassified Variovorax]|uniref:DUF5985 family protein n=1 Tax=unclassified Variovorax TaxID=663243 RepID=UPI00083801D1|nr:MULTISPECIES: DUF5985 family protein [unclassified Variovorax]PNG46572.1 hypothetical protein CHC06_06915 [Variovorax sp. B2]PNG47606.1 hypothetical protein CHC07_06772 [Variovorax sp. B4]VTV14341.1 hypothetical protein WDL1CHR_04888 [Variovorax sp. WDL1]
MDKLIYGLCALTALSCAALLLRGYAKGRVRLLLWSGLCFVGLTANNVLLILDRLLFTSLDMSLWRLSLALVAVLLLLVGLVLESHS